MSEQDRPQNLDPAPAGETEAVIVGIDGSPPSRNALAWAIQEARSLDRPIRLVGAYTIPSVAAAAIDVSYVPIDDSSIRAAVTNTLKEAAAEVKAAGVPVEAVIEIGDAAGVLIDESKSGCLTVVGSRGRGGFAGRLLGTVSSALPAHSACPTVVVPACWDNQAERPAHPTSSRPIRQDGVEVETYDPNAESIEGLRFDGKVVVGVDSLGAESPALWKAARLAVRRGSPLHIVAVITTTVIGPEWLPSTADLERLVNEGADKLVVAKQRLAEEFRTSTSPGRSSTDSPPRCSSVLLTPPRCSSSDRADAADSPASCSVRPRSRCCRTRSARRWSSASPAITVAASSTRPRPSRVSSGRLSRGSPESAARICPKCRKTITEAADRIDRPPR